MSRAHKMDSASDVFTSYPDALRALGWFLLAGIPVMWVISVLITRNPEQRINLTGPGIGVVVGTLILFRLHAWPF